jgi:hypothetical protein
MTGFAALAVGLFRGAEFLLAGDDDVEGGVVRPGGDILIGTGRVTEVTAAGETIS